MAKHAGALLIIVGGTTLGWWILGANIFSRTYERGETLRGSVASTWGTPQKQEPATAWYDIVEQKTQTVERDGQKTTSTYEVRKPVALPLEGTQAAARLELEHRQKGLLWYSTYKVAFDGSFTFRNTAGTTQDVNFRFPLPAGSAIYDDLVFEVNGLPVAFQEQENALLAAVRLAPGAEGRLRAAYRSHGMEKWAYSFGASVSRVRDFALTLTTNFRDIDFPDGSMSPTRKQPEGDGWRLEWRFQNLLSGSEIALTMPEKLQPGPLAGRISYFAPVSLLFFFFVLFIITALRNIELHWMNYFFLACSFFAFHLLLAYLVDHISIHLAFAICSVVSVFLVVSYIRVVVGPRFAFRETALAQFVYLVLFSYAFFLKGFTALSVTIGAIITLYIVMRLTARIRWAERFSAPGQPEVRA